jgi:hypothetical protein
MRKKLIFGKTAAPCVSCYWQTFLPPAAAAASAWMSLLAQPAAAVLLFWRSPRPSRRLHSKQLFLNMALDGGTKKRTTLLLVVHSSDISDMFCSMLQLFYTRVAI